MDQSSTEQQAIDQTKSLLEQNARLKSELAEAKGFFEAIMEHVPEAIIITDARDLSIRMVSKYGRELLGHPRGKAKGPLIVSIPDSETSCMRTALSGQAGRNCRSARATLQGEVITNEEWVLRRSDGKSSTVSAIQAPSWIVTAK